MPFMALGIPQVVITPISDIMLSSLRVLSAVRVATLALSQRTWPISVDLANGVVHGQVG